MDSSLRVFGYVIVVRVQFLKVYAVGGFELSIFIVQWLNKAIAGAAFDAYHDVVLEDQGVSAGIKVVGDLFALVGDLFVLVAW